MTLENSIKDVITQKLEDGSVEKIISEQFEEGLKKALDRMFASYGDVTKILEEQLKSVLVPYLEGYDYSEYIVKMDSVLVEILQNTAVDNKKMLENFKELMTPHEEKIKASDLFNKWMEFVAKNVETDGLEIDYDDYPSYETVQVTMEVEEDEDRSWSSFKHATLIFECEHDEKMNFAIRLSKYTGGRKDKDYDISYDRTPDIKSLRYLKDFEVYLMALAQSGTQLILDKTFDSEDVRPEKEPEASFS